MQMHWQAVSIVAGVKWELIDRRNERVKVVNQTRSEVDDRDRAGWEVLWCVHYGKVGA